MLLIDFNGFGGGVSSCSRSFPLVVDAVLVSVLFADAHQVAVVDAHATLGGVLPLLLF